MSAIPQSHALSPMRSKSQRTHFLLLVCLGLIAFPSPAEAFRGLIFTMRVHGYEFPSDFDNVRVDLSTGHDSNRSDFTEAEIESLHSAELVRAAGFHHDLPLATISFRIALTKNSRLVHERWGRTTTQDDWVRGVTVLFLSADAPSEDLLPANFEIQPIEENSPFTIQEDSPGLASPAPAELWLDDQWVVAIYDYLPEGLEMEPRFEVSPDQRSWAYPTDVIRETFPIQDNRVRVILRARVPAGVPRYFARIREPLVLDPERTNPEPLPPTDIPIPQF